MLPALFVAAVLSDPDRPLVPVATLGQATMICRDHGRIFATPDGKHAITRRGEWFDLEVGRRIDSPFTLPNNAHVHSVLDDGTVVVETPRQLEFYPPGVKRPKRTLDTLGRRTWVAGGGAVSVCLHGWTDDTVSLLVADKSGVWKTVADGLPPVKRLTLNPTGTHAAVLCEGYGDVAVINLKTKMRTDFLEERPPPPPPGQVERSTLCFFGSVRTDVALSPDGQVLHIENVLGVDAYDVTTGIQLEEKSFKARWWQGVPARCVSVLRQFDTPELAWLGDGSKQARVTDGGVLRVFDTVTSEQLDTHSTYPGFFGVTAIDDRRAITWTEDGRLITWDLATGKPTGKLRLDLTGELTLRYGEVKFSPDGKELIARDGSGFGRSVHADARTGRKLLSERSLHPVFLLDGRVLIHSQQKYTLSKPGNDTPLVEGVGSDDPKARLRFDQVGRLAVMITCGGVTVYELATGKRRCGIQLPDEPRTRPHGGGLCASGVFGRELVVVREGDALVFDLPTQKLVRHFEFDPGGYRLATISADGRWLATTSDYGKLSNITLFPLDHPNPPAVAVELPIRTSTYTTGLAFTPDGKRLLTSHAGGIAHVWDITRFTSDTGSPREDELWVALGADDGEAVGKCMAELVQTPRVAVAMIGRRLLPVERIDEKAVKTRIAELGSADFRTREAATKAIESLDERVVPLV